jgi:hypothetical protein
VPKEEIFDELDIERKDQASIIIETYENTELFNEVDINVRKYLELFSDTEDISNLEKLNLGSFLNEIFIEVSEWDPSIIDLVNKYNIAFSSISKNREENNIRYNIALWVGGFLDKTRYSDVENYILEFLEYEYSILPFISNTEINENKNIVKLEHLNKDFYMTTLRLSMINNYFCADIKYYDPDNNELHLKFGKDTDNYNYDDIIRYIRSKRFSFEKYVVENKTLEYDNEKLELVKEHKNIGKGNRKIYNYIKVNDTKIKIEDFKKLRGGIDLTNFIVIKDFKDKKIPTYELPFLDWSDINNNFDSQIYNEEYIVDYINTYLANRVDKEIKKNLTL